MDDFVWYWIVVVCVIMAGIIFGPREMAPWEIDEEVDRELGR